MEKSPDFRIRNKSSNSRFTAQVGKNRQRVRKSQSIVSDWKSQMGSIETEKPSEVTMDSTENKDFKILLEEIRELDRKQRNHIAQVRVQIGKQKELIKNLKSENEELKQRNRRRRRINPRQLLRILQTNIMQEQYRDEEYEQMQLEMIINQSYAAEQEIYSHRHNDEIQNTLPSEEINIPIPNTNSDHLCSICISLIKTNTNSKTLEKCGHKFHPECIDGWLISNPHCPICHTSINS
ncbi:unnamed protein product [Blepharisma stoltei]|uniref:RING-type E3 ubiquitin transferase n=1 Tax=Blepharisma stoltei TaxID=1481888 RepID=A0AAU9ICE9_9CILI|nr:unnamed protein product [Blepharisma stoltei]